MIKIINTIKRSAFSLIRWFLIGLYLSIYDIIITLSISETRIAAGNAIILSSIIYLSKWNTNSYNPIPN